ncbi:MAG: hypothetical protein KC620_23510 [Myxococcales bacterium]|nr:hypothetical protein [Myxococcales bacterium]
MTHPALRIPRDALLALAVAFSLFALAACDEAADATALDAEVAAESAPTWYADLKPVFERRCVSCHSEGGAAPFRLDSLETVSAMAPAALASIEAGRMPPWMPDPDCRPFRNERLMPAEEVELLRRWVDGGKPEGDPANAAPDARPERRTFEPTTIARPTEAYTPTEALNDDYRCFILDTEFPTDTFLTASQVRPDAGALVHHVLVYAIAPEGLDRLYEADAAEEGNGYTCFGGPFPNTGSGSLQDSMGSSGFPTQLGAWVPGNEPQILEEGTAIRIAAGSRIVMQVHYNLVGNETQPDATEFAMRLTDETPQWLLNTRPIVVHELEIPANDPAAVNRRVYRNYTNDPITLGSVSAHMHLLGNRFRSTVLRADGTEECLFDIPAWDFNWQQSYLFPRDELVVVQPGEALTIECEYDNSQANQAYVDGVQRESVDVTWGEGTYDEMCMLYMSILTPYTPPQTLSCAMGEQCLAECAAEGRSTSDCLIGCPMPVTCKGCLLQSIIGCGGAVCLGALNEVRNDPCLETCMINSAILNGDTSACLRDECGDKYAAVTDCLDPVLDSGRCDAQMVGCGLMGE